MADMSAPSPLVQLQGIRFGFPGHTTPLFNDLEFSLPAQERIGLIGPNGSGKTTLLRVIMGLLAPQHGSVSFSGSPVHTREDWRTLRQHIGFVFQDSDDQLFCPTVLEDVAFGPRNLGLSREHARTRALETLADLELTALAEAMTHTLSGGQKKLVALATVLAMRPQALLLDEPTNDLDHDARNRLIDILERLDTALLIVSHDWDFLDQTTSRLCELHAGQLECNGNVTLHSHVHAHVRGGVPHKHGDSSPS